MIKNKIPNIKDLKTSYKVTKLVLKTPEYSALSVFLIPTFLILLLLPTDYTLIVDIIIFGDQPIPSRLNVLYQILPLTGSYTYSIATDILFYLVSITVSINITLLVYHFKEHDMKITDGTGGTAATIIAVLGSGCASCGSALIVGVFSLFGLSGILTLLPLEGAEFLLLALLITIFSIIWICKGLRGGMVRGCPIE